MRAVNLWNCTLQRAVEVEYLNIVMIRSAYILERPKAVRLLEECETELTINYEFTELQSKFVG